MECLHCGKRLPLLRRLSDGEFCIPEHRTAYHDEQQRLAVKRLIDARWPDKKPLATRQPVAVAQITEHDWLPEPPAPELRADEPLVFLSVAPYPKHSQDCTLYFEHQIPVEMGVVLPQPACRLKRPVDRCPSIPLLFAFSAVNRPHAFVVKPLLDAWGLAVLRPECRLGLDNQDSALGNAQVERPCEPPRVDSLCALSFQTGTSAGEPAGIAGLNSVIPERFEQDVQMPAQCSAMIGLAEIPGVIDSLPIAQRMISLHVRVVDSKHVGDQPVELGMKPKMRLPNFSMPEPRERLPRRIGRLRRPIPVSKLALTWSSDAMDRWREEQAQPLMAGRATLCGIPRFEAVPFQPSFDHAGDHVDWPPMLDVVPPEVEKPASAMYQAEPMLVAKPRLKRSARTLRTTFQPDSLGTLQARMPYGFPEFHDGSKPKSFSPEEFHAWLNVPVFAPQPQARRRACALLCGKSGVESIPGQPKRSEISRSAGLEPLFSAISPLLQPTRLTTLKPPLLTKKKGFTVDPEEVLRNKLIPKIQMRGLHFWREEPADLKWITLGLPLVVIIVFQATMQKRNSAMAKPEVAVSQQMAETGIPSGAGVQEVAVRPAVASRPGPQTPGPQSVDAPEAMPEPPVRRPEPESSFLGPVGKFFDQRLHNLRLNLAERAGVDLTEDFRSGLAAWQGASDWARTWSYDRVGLLRPGQLALYQPSITLSDYNFEFTVTTEHGAAGWVFRARNLTNYYGMRLQRVKSGSGNTGVLERWIVTGGREFAHKSIPLRLPVWDGNTSEVKMTVQGNSFTTLVNGQIADTWTDSKFETGGIGFTNERGGDARIHKVSVSYQNDVVGKLCAMLVPHDLILKQQGTEGRILR